MYTNTTLLSFFSNVHQWNCSSIWKGVTNINIRLKSVAAAAAVPIPLYWCGLCEQNVISFLPTHLPLSHPLAHSSCQGHHQNWHHKSHDAFRSHRWLKHAQKCGTGRLTWSVNRAWPCLHGLCCSKGLVGTGWVFSFWGHSVLWA